MSENQVKTIREIIKVGKTDASNFDGKTLNALARRGLIKVTESRKGRFVSITAKGKKSLN